VPYDSPSAFGVSSLCGFPRSLATEDSFGNMIFILTLHLILNATLAFTLLGLFLLYVKGCPSANK
jgi:hypothetical protein